MTRLCRHRGRRRYSSNPFATSALEGGGLLAPRPGRFTRRKEPLPIVQEAGWAPGPAWTGAENLATPPGFDPRTAQPVTSRYTDWAIAAHLLFNTQHSNKKSKIYTKDMMTQFLYTMNGLYWMVMNQKVIENFWCTPRMTPFIYIR